MTGVRSQGRDDLWQPHPWLKIMRGLYSESGVPVTAEAALGHTPLWHGLLILGGDIGSLKFNQKRISGEERKIVRTHVAWKLLGDRPNDLMCPATFWEAMLIRAVLYGNSLCEIARNRGGRPLSVADGGGLKMLLPEHTYPWFDEQGKLWIETRDLLPNNRLDKPRRIDPDDVYHLPSLSSDGFWGRSLLDVAKNRIGNGLGLEKQHNRMMQNGMQPDWLFSFPIEIDEEDQIALEKRMKQRNKGLDNTGESLVMDNDVKATQLGMTFEAAQFTELVKLDIQMTASLLGIPPMMLGLPDKMTFSNVEESERHYVNRTLRRWLNKIQQEARAKLLTDTERERFEFEHDLSPLLKGRLSERYAAQNQAITAMWKTRNEVRIEEGYNPVEGGDEFQNPNTTSGGGNDSEETPEKEDDESGVTPEQDKRLIAGQLNTLLNVEVSKLAEACRNRKNVLDWAEAYYTREFREVLHQLTPNTAADYCDRRFKIFRHTTDHVTDTNRLAGLIQTQKLSVDDRVCGLLNAEFSA